MCDPCSRNVEMRESPGLGRGLFATNDIPSRTVVEISPVLVMDAENWEAHGKHTIMNHYAFVWRDGKPRHSMALPLGLGGIFNHSSDPNCGWLCDIENKLIKFLSLREIRVNEELYINYGEIWFEDAHPGRDDEES